MVVTIEIHCGKLVYMCNHGPIIHS